MVTSVGTPVESLEFRLLGPLQLSRGGDLLKLPSSRKVRALLGYLVLASRPVSRSQICELLWDVPNDPRGELRWCLSKLRGLIDEKGRKRVIADGSSVRIDLSDCVVDTLEVTRAPEHGIQKLGVERQQALAAHFSGELLEGLEISRSPMFDAWITAERRRFRVVKMRGMKYRGGYHDFTIETGGLVIYPRLVPAEHHKAFLGELTSTDSPELDALLGGGVERGTSLLLIGGAGVGKSSIALTYAMAAAKRGERVGVFAFDEGLGTVFARAAGLGLALQAQVESGHICVQQIDPAEMSPGEFAHIVRHRVEHDVAANAHASASTGGVGLHRREAAEDLGGERQLAGIEQLRVLLDGVQDIGRPRGAGR